MTGMVIFTAATHLLIPIVFIVGLWRAKFTSKTAWIVATVGSSAFIGYMLLTGRWDWFSYYLRFLIPLALLVAVYVSYRRTRSMPWWSRPGSIGNWVSLGAYAFLAVLFTFFIASALGGMSAGDNRAVELSFPLQDGVFYVGQGGANPTLNYHNTDPAQRFAVDATSLNLAGTRTVGLLPSDPARYEIFDKEIHSPCAGEVIRAEDGNMDHSGPNEDPQNPAGNHVVVRCQANGVAGQSQPAVDVLLAHMRQDSVAVDEGAEIEERQLLGRVGNSGNTTEPHIHVHAVSSGSGESALDGEGVPIHFDGRFLVRNSLLF